MEKINYVQYGCGWTAPDGWRNFDASPTLRFERLPFIGRFYSKNESRFPDNVEFGDIVQGLPIKARSCAGVYCSHVLEHLSLDGLRIALQNTYSIIDSGGIFRLVLPDLEYSVKLYLNNPSNEASISFMKETFLGQESRTKSIKEFLALWLGNSRHLWMWDYKSIEIELKKAGFVAIRRASYGDSIDSKFQEVEAADRWNNCLGVECKKSA